MIEKDIYLDETMRFAVECLDLCIITGIFLWKQRFLTIKKNTHTHTEAVTICLGIGFPGSRVNAIAAQQKGLVC